MDSQQSDSTGSPHASEPSFSPDDIMDLRLDPSDPLNYLLNSTQREDSSADGSFSGSNDSGSPADWSDLSSMLPPPPGLDSDGQLDKYYDMDMNMDLENFSLSNILDMNFDPSTMSVDPSALHFNPPPQNGLDQSPFPFTFQPKAETVPTQPGSVQSRRLSITSSSSSSGASLSPIMDSQMVYPSNNASLPTPPALMPQPPLPPHVASEDPSIAMAQRVLQAAGVMHAVPMSAQYSHLPQNPGAGTPAIPRFTAHPAPSVGCSSASSTPPPQTPPSGAMATGRTKTSHTTIERRYRTNLNARILSLRNAVPALRFLEDREPKKPSMTTPVNDVPNTNPVVLDEKGLADGVKPPRKLSKANVLLKATEYILVLKRREKRLSRSQDSLKALLGGLVGGQVLVDEWEREWRRMWGDVLDDPSEGIYSEANLMGLGMAEDDEDEDSGDEETGGKRKRARVEAAPRVRKEKAPPAQQASTIVVNADGSTSVVVPEKRKRGRPRKNPLPPQAAETAGPQPMKAEVVPTPRASGTQQFLFATFALFSFFNNGPLANYTMPKQHHAHSGVVLTAHPLAADVPPPNLTWVPTTHELIGYFHLLVSVLVFASFFWPAISAFLGGKMSAVGRAGDKQVLSAALDQSQRGKEDEAQNIRDALTGSSVKGVWDLVTGWLPGHGDDHKAKKSGKFEQLGLEQRAWVRLGEICVLRGETNVFTRLSTYVHLRLHLAWFTATAADLSTLALILYPCSFGRAMARSIWRAALKSQTGAPDRVAYRRRLSVSGNAVAVQVRAHERLVLETLDVDSAFEKLACAGAGGSRLAPIGVLASVLVKERVKAHLAAAFVRAVLGEGEGDEDDPRELRRTVEACRSLGGEMRALGDLLERVVEGEGETVCEESLRWAGGGAGDVEKDIRTFLSAIARYRRITMSGSVVRTDEYELRKALGDVVFDAAIETSPRLEEARDQVVEMLWKQRTNGGRRVRYAQA